MEVPINYEFPNRAGYFNHNELNKFALCLGFHPNLFINHLQPQLNVNSHVPTNSIIQLLNNTKFVMDIHKSMNIHDKDYNSNLIQRVCHLLDQRAISFKEISNICRCFSLYEDKDGNGIVADRQIILAVLKWCNKVISPLQLTNELHNITPELSLPKRLTLTEFLGIYLLSTDLTQLQRNTKLENVPTSRDSTDLYVLPNHDTKSLQYERILTKLDQEYHNQMYMTVKTKQISLDLCPLIKINMRRELYIKSQGSLKGLSQRLLHSEGKLFGRGQTKCLSCLTHQVRDRVTEKSPDILESSSLDELLTMQKSRENSLKSPERSRLEVPSILDEELVNSDPLTTSSKKILYQASTGQDRTITLPRLDPGLGSSRSKLTETGDYRYNGESTDSREGEIVDLKWTLIRSKTNLTKYIASLKTSH